MPAHSQTRKQTFSLAGNFVNQLASFFSREAKKNTHIRIFTEITSIYFPSCVIGIIHFVSSVERISFSTSTTTCDLVGR